MSANADKQLARQEADKWPQRRQDANLHPQGRHVRRHGCGSPCPVVSPLPGCFPTSCTPEKPSVAHKTVRLNEDDGSIDFVVEGARFFAEGGAWDQDSAMDPHDYPPPHTPQRHARTHACTHAHCGWPRPASTSGVLRRACHQLALQRDTPTVAAQGSAPEDWRRWQPLRLPPSSTAVQAIL